MQPKWPDKKITCTELCKRSGFSFNVATKLRNRGGPCAEETVQKICDVLGIRIVDLLDDETAWSAYEAKLKEAEAIRPRTVPIERLTAKNPIYDIKVST